MLINMAFFPDFFYIERDAIFSTIVKLGKIVDLEMNFKNLY